MDDDEPELRGYVDDDRPLGGRRRRLALQVVVVVGLIALVMPGVLISMSVATATAGSTCAVYVQIYRPEAARADARFELFARDPGWQCYSVDSENRATLVIAMGLIPSGPRRIEVDPVS